LVLVFFRFQKWFWLFPSFWWPFFNNLIL
jgi:hypothetical protein